MNSLSAGLLPDGRLAVNTDVLDPTDFDGQQVIKYLAHCALAPDDVLVAEVDGVEYEFVGSLAVAPEWKDEGLSAAKQQAMTACLMAHVNEFGIPVSISVRGIGQAVSQEEIERFPWNEGTFFGNVFEQSGARYACLGDDAPDVSTGFPHAAGDRVLRRCADIDDPNDTTTRCGFEYVGRCSDICDTQVGGNYTDCWAEGVQYDQTATTWLLAYDDEASTLTEATYNEFYGE